MKHNDGPTKKLAPMIAPDTCCPHSFSDDGGIQLEVNCLGCAGAHDLANSKCLTGVVNVVSAGADPEAIILKGFIHKRYRGEVVRQAAAAAHELAALNRALLASEPPSDKRCRTCAASSDQVVAALKRRLMESPSDYVSSVDAIVKDVERIALSTTCEKARVCVSKGFSASTLKRGR